MNLYHHVEEMMRTRGKPVNEKKIAPNTFLIKHPFYILLKYYNTYLIFFHPDGSLTLTMHGYNTYTTRRRLNWFISEYGAHVFSKHRIPYISDGKTTVPFYDGIRVTPKGIIVDNERKNLLKEYESRAKKLNNLIARYARGITQEVLEAHNPIYDEDCPACEALDAKHIKEHVIRKEYKASLFYTALKDYRKNFKEFYLRFRRIEPFMVGETKRAVRMLLFRLLAYSEGLPVRWEGN